MNVKTKRTVLNKMELAAAAGMSRMKIDYALRIKKLQFDLTDGHGRPLFLASRINKIAELLTR